MKKSLVTLSTSALVLAAISGLTSCGPQKEQILIYSTAESERVEFTRRELNAKFPEYDIILQEIGTGALVSKLQAEGRNTDCDIIYELEITNMETLLKQDSNFFYTLSDYDFNKFTDMNLPRNHKKYAPECMTHCAIIYNKKVLNDRGLDVPETYEDLLKPQYKDLISMPSPKSSGTGYAFFNGLVSEMGETNAIDYFDSLKTNIKEFTTSGSTPIKGVDRGEIAIGFAMLWQCVEYKANNSNLEFTYLDRDLPYNLYQMAVINGKQERNCVKEVFDYIFNDLNKREVEKFIPEPVYKEFTPENPDFPTDFESINMVGIADPDYKANLLDKWIA